MEVEDEEWFSNVQQNSRITQVVGSDISELRDQMMSTEIDSTLLSSFNSSSACTEEEPAYILCDSFPNDIIDLDNTYQISNENLPSETILQRMISYGFDEIENRHDNNDKNCENYNVICKIASISLTMNLIKPPQGQIMMRIQKIMKAITLLAMTKRLKVLLKITCKIMKLVSMHMKIYLKMARKKENTLRQNT